MTSLLASLFYFWASGFFLVAFFYCAHALINHKLNRLPIIIQLAMCCLSWSLVVAALWDLFRGEK